MFFVYLLIAALLGPLILGAVAGQAPSGPRHAVLVGVAVVFPVLVAAVVWIYMHLSEYPDAISSVDDFSLLFIWWGSVLLLPVSSGLTLIGRMAGRYWSNDFGV